MTYNFVPASDLQKSAAVPYISVSSGGKVLAKTGAIIPAIYRVTATMTDGSKVSGAIDISVDSAMTDIELGRVNESYAFEKANSITVEFDKKEVLCYAITKGNSHFADLNISSSNTGIAEVSRNGDYFMVYFNKKGTVTITVKSTDGSNITRKLKIKIV